METLTKTAHWLKSSAWEGLHDINLPQYNIGIWERDADPKLQGFISLLLSQSWKTINGEGNWNEVGTSLDEGLATCIGLDPKGHLMFRNEITILAERFATIAPDTCYRWRFAKVQSNMCRLFHSDINDLRLLCTYCGPGTVWLTNDNINQAALRNRDVEQIAIDARRVEQVRTFDVALLKGALHEHCDVGAVIHRSPTIEEAGETRIVFRMDTGGLVGM